MAAMSKWIAVVVIAGFMGTAAVIPAHAADKKSGSNTATMRGKGGAFVTILSPKEGEILSHIKAIILKYEMSPGHKGDHVHFYVDSDNVGLSWIKKGTFDLGKLRQGKHELSIKLINKIHVPIGIEASVNVTVP